MKHLAALRASLCALFLSLAAVPAAAGEPEPTGGLIHQVSIGILAHDVPYMWSGFNREPITPDLNVEVMFRPGISFFGGTLRPAIGGTYNFDGYTSKAYVDARWVKEFHHHWFLGLGLGIAWHDGDTISNRRDHKQLGKEWLFHDTVEIGYRFDRHQSISLYFEHISNADTADRNQGLDALGVRYGYRF